jgi:hypothetical protein
MTIISTANFGLASYNKDEQCDIDSIDIKFSHENLKYE